MMAQRALGFKYEQEPRDIGMTALGGLPLYLDLAHGLGLAASADKHLSVRTKNGQGWTDGQMVMALVLLNLAGGDSVDDIRILENDEGFGRILRKVEKTGMNRKARRQLARRWRKGRNRSFPLPSAIFRYLAAFHDPGQETQRVQGKAFIPAPNKHLRGFMKMMKEFLSFLQQNRPQKRATLDMDATLAETTKLEALYCYKGFKSYQPLNTWWAEQDVIVHTEFRDGNVPAGFEQKRVLAQALDCLPASVEEVQVRSDTAGYQHDLLRYCEMGENERFGRIEFAIGCDVTPEFKKAVSGVPESDWHPFMKRVNGREIETGKQWAEVCFVPNAIGHSKNGPAYRYLATREVLQEQMNFPGMEEAPKQLPFPSMPFSHKRYKVFGIVTNMDGDGNDLIGWLHQRCGKSEAAHSVMKQDLAGGTMPSKDYGENAAWWWLMILSLNLNAALKHLALDASWASRRMKAIRFGLINIAARVMEQSRYLKVRLCRGHGLFRWFTAIRIRIALLKPAPPG